MKKLLLSMLSYKNQIIIYLNKVSVGKNAQIRGSIKFCGNGKLIIGENTIINSSAIANPIGGNRSVFYVINKSIINIGNNCGVSNCIFCSAIGIVIGDRTIIGANCSIYDNDFHSTNYMNRCKIPDTDIAKKVVNIGRDVFIGAHCIITKGVNIGDRSIIGVGSVVTKNVPPDEVWGGNPAKFIKKIVD